MNVLFISDLGSLGGGETSLYNLINEFNAKKEEYNIKPFLICKVPGKLVDKCKKINVQCEVIDFKTSFKKIRIMESVRNFKNIRKFLEDNDIDIIQCNEWSSALVFSCICKLLKRKCRIIWVCHGQWYKFNFIKRTFINLLIDKIVAVSDSVLNNLIRNNILKRKVTKQNLGIDVEKFRNGQGYKIRKQIQLKEQDRLLGVIARFQPIKGQKLIVQAAKLLKEEGYSNYKFILVGDSIFNSKLDMQYKNEIINMIKEYKLENSILLLGERSDIPDILNAIDALIIPSINESFGMVVIEAFAAGCPVISTPCDGTKELIDNRVNGIILNNRSSEELTESIKSIFYDENLRQSIKLNALKQSELFSINKVCNFYSNLYR